MEDNQGRHFVPTHGAWCWYKVAAILKSEGHKVTTLDMAASRINPKQVHEIQSFTDYVEPLMKFMESLPQEERVILVGHCMGGTCIVLAMEKFPHKICVAVFAAALMPGPAFSYFTIKGRGSQISLSHSLNSKF